MVYLLICFIISQVRGESEVLKGCAGRRHTIHLTNIYDTYYTGVIHVGDPPQKLRVQFDTASVDLLVFSSGMCDLNATLCEHRLYYNHSLSRTYIKDGRYYEIGYEDVNNTGIISKDDVELGCLKVKDQLFVEMLTTNGEPNENYTWYDGIFGLGFPAGSRIPANPVLQNLIDLKMIDNPIFAFYLPRSDKQAKLTIGGVDSAHFIPPINYVKTHPDYYLNFNITSMYVNDKQVGENILGIFDSASPDITGHPDIINEINKLIDGELGTETPEWFIDCDPDYTNFPVVTFTIGGKNYSMEGPEYTIKSLSGRCSSGFEGFEDLDHIIVLGTPFMRKFYTIFDYGQKRLGLALAK